MFLKNAQGKERLHNRQKRGCFAENLLNLLLNVPFIYWLDNK